jgi:hypothetical protein
VVRRVHHQQGPWRAPGSQHPPHIFGLHQYVNPNDNLFAWLTNRTAAVYVHELSVLGEFVTIDRESVEHVRAVVHYIQEYYLLQLIKNGHHIIHSIPIAHLDNGFTLTSFTFQVYSKLEWTRTNCIHYDVTHHESPTLLILGNYRLVPVPTGRVKWTTRVTIKRRDVHGTVMLSRKSFFQNILLAAFARINAETTLVPRFAGVDAGQWRLELSKWSEHEIRKSIPARAWEIQRAGILSYVWDHGDQWVYTHNGAPGDLSNGKFTVACESYLNTIHRISDRLF